MASTLSKAFEEAIKRGPTPTDPYYFPISHPSWQELAQAVQASKPPSDDKGHVITKP